MLWNSKYVCVIDCKRENLINMVFFFLVGWKEVKKKINICMIKKQHTTKNIVHLAYSTKNEDNSN